MRKTVNTIKQQFGKKVNVDVLMKDVDGSHKAYCADGIDSVVPRKYDPAALVLLQDMQTERT